MLLRQDVPGGIGAFLVQTTRVAALPAGFRMTWVTLPKSK